MIEIKKFSANWCGPCRALKPIINQLKSEYTDFKFTDIDRDKDFMATHKYRVRALPTIVILKDGKEVSRKIGFMTKEQLKNWFNIYQ